MPVHGMVLTVEVWGEQKLCWLPILQELTGHLRGGPKTLSRSCVLS